MPDAGRRRVTVEKDSFADALGRRYRVTDPDGTVVEVFRLCPAIATAATTEAALAERVARLSAFSHQGFAPVRRAERVLGIADNLAVVSASVPGIRLSSLLRVGAEKGIAPGAGVVRSLGRQVARAMADFHRACPDLSHGALGPERVIVCPDGRAVIAEHVLAPVLEPLRMNRAAFWTTFQVAVPSSAGSVRFDQVTDVVQLGTVVLSLVLGRPIGPDEYPREVERLLTEPASAGPSPLGSPAMRAWLLRAFQVQLRTAFRTAVDAAAAFDEVVADEPLHKSQLSAVVAYLQALGCGSSEPAGNDGSGGSGGVRPPGSATGGRAASTQGSFKVVAVSEALDRPPAASETPKPAPGKTARMPVAHGGAWSSIRRRVGIVAVSIGLLGVLGLLYVGAHLHLASSISHVGHHAMVTRQVLPVPRHPL